MRLIFGDLAPDRAAQPGLAVLHEHAVEEGGDIGRAQQLAVGSEMRPFEDDVVTLPFAGPPRRVHQRRLPRIDRADGRSEEHTSELQSLMRISYAVFCLKKKN